MVKKAVSKVKKAIPVPMQPMPMIGNPAPKQPTNIDILNNLLGKSKPTAKPKKKAVAKKKTKKVGK